MAGCLRKHWHLNPPDLRGNLVFRPCLNARPVMHDNFGDAGNASFDVYDRDLIELLRNRQLQYFFL